MQTQTESRARRSDSQLAEPQTVQGTDAAIGDARDDTAAPGTASAPADCDCPGKRGSQATAAPAETAMQVASSDPESLDGMEVGPGIPVTAPLFVSDAAAGGSPDDRRLTAAPATPTYALVNVRNSTGSVLVIEFRWGTAAWQTRSIDPGSSRSFWWTYASGSTSSPTFYIRRGSSTWALRRYAADSTNVSQAAKYEFYSSTGLRAIDGEVFPGDWTSVNWFRFGNWSNGIYVNGVRVERYMGPTYGYNWNYRVQIVDVSLSSGLPCVPGQHWEGLVRAKVSGSGGGFLDTGDMAVHSGGGTKTQNFDSVNPGALTTCTLWRRTWCEW